jgi:peptidoglycan/LPS O-acetylase OafA/YrhL
MRVRIHPRNVFGFVDNIPNLLQRKTSSGWFLPQIDGLRFVAIATVLAVHIVAFAIGKNTVPVQSTWLIDNHEHLARGVQLFFVISGFVIAMPFVVNATKGGPRVLLKNFYVRRLTRLEPPFLIAMVLTYASLVLVHHSSARELLPHLLSTCTYTHAIIYGGKSPIAFITWSLEIEVQFYLIAPLIMIAFRLRPWVRRSILILLAVASLGTQTLISHTHPVLASSLIADLCFFIAGIIVCDLAIASDLWKDQRRPSWDIIGCIAIVAGYSISTRAFWSNAAMASFFGIAAIAAFRGTALARLMAARWLTAIGGMCYTIYLLHVPLIYLLGHIIAQAMRWPDLSLNALAAIILIPPPILVACSLFFLVIEKPCMNKRWPADLVRFVFASRQDNGASETAGV